MGIRNSAVTTAVEEKPCTMVAEREQFEREKVITEATYLTFKGVDGYDVYNCSVPFKLNETGKDEFTLVPNAMMWQLEDPFVSFVHGEMVFGGTRVTKNHGKVCEYHTDFYRGPPNDLVYFTSGPKKMKDIRLVELADKRIGVFSHHKSNHECLTGFITISSIDDLCAEVIDAAVPIDHTLFGDAWGGVNQAYLLTSDKIGCISHHGYVAKNENGVTLNVYCITSFVYDPATNGVFAYKILGTKNCFPPYPAKVERLEDCAFVSGIVMRKDGKCDLYSGVGDTREGRMVIDYPFEGHGDIVDQLAYNYPK